MMQISFGVSNSTRLDEIVRQRADDRRRQEGDQDAEHEAPRPRGRAAGRAAIFQQPAEIDGEDRQDRAELDQHLEGLAGRFEAEEMAGQQDMAGRRDRDELGQPLEQAEQQGFDDRLIFHDYTSHRIADRAAGDCLSWRGTAPIGRAP